MPSAEHEAPLELAELDPNLVTWLLANVFDVKVPDYHHTRDHPTEVRVLVPRTYRADGMQVYCDAADRPVLATVLEVQRGWDKIKRRTWKLYVAQLEAELDVDAALVVYCPDPSIAQRYRDLFAADGLSLSLRPLIFTPEDVPLITDEDVARANPALTVLSAISHGADAEVEAMFPGLLAALRAADPEKAILYHDVVLAGLPEALQARWEEFMTATDSRFRSEVMRGAWAEGRAEGKVEGKAEGEAGSILRVLERRGVAVPDEVRDQILGCTDLAQLENWLDSAATVGDIVRC